MPEEIHSQEHDYYYVEITAWDKLVDIYRILSNNNQKWLYRGQADSSWSLETSLERFHEKIKDQNNLPSRSECERETYWQFIRPANLFNANNRASEECLYWLSMMQHYTAPTRLLDFTRSFYVALFFALEEAALPENGEEKYSAVWVINQTILDGSSDKANDEKAYEKETKVNEIVWKSLNNKPKSDPGVIVAKPWILNDRIYIQQGHFIVPKNVEQSFIENISETLRIDPSLQNYKLPEKGKVNINEIQSKLNKTALLKIKIKISSELLMEAMSNLYRMNISAATLFPGLDGYGRSMKTVLWEYARTKGK